jgi:hypothetical protein
VVGELVEQVEGPHGTGCRRRREAAVEVVGDGEPEADAPIGQEIEAGGTAQGSPSTVAPTPWVPVDDGAEGLPPSSPGSVSGS